jgi:hypothetical protein
MSRWKAFAIHFCISLAVFLVLLAIIIFVWYPGILFEVDGGWSGLRIIIGVDLVLGPLLTLVVFKAGKPKLKFDLGCIAGLQIICLLAGTWLVYNERPLVMVLAFDTVYSLAAQEFELFEKDITFFEEYPGASPKMFFVELPEDGASVVALVMRSQFFGEPLFIQTEKFKPMLSVNVDFSSIFTRESDVRLTVTEDLLNQLDENCLLSKFVSPHTTGYVCFDSEQGRFSSFYDNEYVRDVAE